MNNIKCNARLITIEIATIDKCEIIDDTRNVHCRTELVKNNNIQNEIGKILKHDKFASSSKIISNLVN